MNNMCIAVKTSYVSAPQEGGGGHQGNFQPQRNGNFRALVLAWVEHMLLNGAAQIEETATKLEGRLRNSIFWETEHTSLLIIALPRGYLVSSVV
jgi:hypothetical protein